MRFIAKVLVIVPFTLILMACAPVPPPQPDHFNDEQLDILQKQLLELQKIQNDTKTKLDDAQAVIQSLSIKVKALEEKQAVAISARHETRQTTAVQKKPGKASTTASKQKNLRKKKKVRRQE